MRKLLLSTFDLARLPFNVDGSETGTRSQDRQIICQGDECAKRRYQYAVHRVLQKRQEYPGAVFTQWCLPARAWMRGFSRFIGVYCAWLAADELPASNRNAVERATSVERKEARARLPKQGCSDASLLRCAAPDWPPESAFPHAEIPAARFWRPHP